MFDPDLIEIVASVLRGLQFNGKPAFSNVFTEVVDGHIHLDVEGVGGELYFPLMNSHHDKDAEPVPGRWYCVDCDTIYTGVKSRSQIPCYANHDVKKLSDATWQLLCEKYGPVVSAEGAPRLVDVSINETDECTLFLSHPSAWYGVQRLSGATIPVHKWKPLTAYDVTVDAEPITFAYPFGPVPGFATVEELTVEALDKLIADDKTPHRLMLP